MRARKAAGLTGEEMARRLGWQRTKISKLENGRQMPSRADLQAWAEITGQPEVAPELLELLAEAQAVHRQWRHKLRGGHATLQAEFDALVRGASRIRNFEIMLIPGLLQTPDYARCRALETVRLLGTDPAKVEETVAARMQRQSVLYDTSKTFEFVICEAAMSYLTCPPDVMRVQLDRLLSVQGLGNVAFGIIPAGRELTLTPQVGFLMTDDLVTIETFTGVDNPSPPESAKYSEIADALMAEAVTGDQVRQLINSATERLRPA